MIEREFVAQKTKEYYIKKYIEGKLNKVGISEIKLKKIPLGEKIIIYTNRPSLIVGSKGANIKDLTKILKRDFKLENPQVEINEIKDIFLDANIVAERIADSLERFGSARFKGVGHKMMANVINSGALGVEIIISGKIPGARAKNWRFYQGYLKKCGDIAVVGVKKAQKNALLKSGIIGIKVAIMPPDVKLPDNIQIIDEVQQEVGEVGKEEKKKVSKPKKTTTEKKKKAEKSEKKETKSKETAEPLEEVASVEKVEEAEPVEEETKKSAPEPVEEETPAEEETTEEVSKENEKDEQ